MADEIIISRTDDGMNEFGLITRELITLSV